MGSVKLSPDQPLLFNAATLQSLVDCTPDIDHYHYYYHLVAVHSPVVAPDYRILGPERMGNSAVLDSLPVSSGRQEVSLAMIEGEEDIGCIDFGLVVRQVAVGTDCKLDLGMVVLGMGCRELVLVVLVDIVVVDRSSDFAHCIGEVGCWMLDIAILAGCIVDFVENLGLADCIAVVTEVAMTRAAVDYLECIVAAV